MAEGFGTPTSAIDAWANEESDYNYQTTGFSEQTGHFTQLVWQNTRRVGCGAVWCGDKKGDNGAFHWFMVCEYMPRGNVIGRFQQNVHKPGSSKEGKPGLGAGSRLSGSSKLLVALVTVSSLAAMCL